MEACALVSCIVMVWGCSVCVLLAQQHSPGQDRRASGTRCFMLGYVVEKVPRHTSETRTLTKVRLLSLRPQVRWSATA